MQGGLWFGLGNARKAMVGGADLMVISWAELGCKGGRQGEMAEALSGLFMFFPLPLPLFSSTAGLRVLWFGESDAAGKRQHSITDMGRYLGSLSARYCCCCSGKCAVSPVLGGHRDWLSAPGAAEVEKHWPEVTAGTRRTHPTCPNAARHVNKRVSCRLSARDCLIIVISRKTIGNVLIESSTIEAVWRVLG